MFKKAKASWSAWKSLLTEGNDDFSFWYHKNFWNVLNQQNMCQRCYAETVEWRQIDGQDICQGCWEQQCSEEFWRTVTSVSNLLQSNPEHCWCKECTPNQTFECAECKTIQPWCKGADDGDFEICDDCWCKKYGY